MIPERIERYLADHHLPFVHTTHVRAVAASASRPRSTCPAIASRNPWW